MRELKDTISNWEYYPKLDIYLKSPIGINISNWGLGIYESSKAESENKSPIPNQIKYHQLVIPNTQLGISHPIGYFLLLVLYY